MRRAREPEGKGPTRLLNVCVESFLIGFLVLLLSRIDLINPPRPPPEGGSNGGPLLDLLSVDADYLAEEVGAVLTTPPAIV